jgi:hypothetical protein
MAEIDVTPAGTINVKVPPDVYSFAPPVRIELLAALGAPDPSPLFAVTVNV